jgi:hypothetical protein
MPPATMLIIKIDAQLTQLAQSVYRLPIRCPIDFALQRWAARFPLKP